jgi:hypothetical protein
LGIERIKRNLCLDVDDVVNWCRLKIKIEVAEIIYFSKFNSHAQTNPYSKRSCGNWAVFTSCSFKRLAVFIRANFS